MNRLKELLIGASSPELMKTERDVGEANNSATDLIFQVTA